MSAEGFLARLAADPALWSDFCGLCDCGGRLQGTASASRGFALAESLLARIGPVRDEPVAYAGWHCGEARVTALGTGAELACTPLLGSAATPPEGLVVEALDLGRGGPAELAGVDVAGRAVLARHEYPFAAGTIHRRVKLAAARAAGAAAFLIVQPEPGVGPVSGSSGRGGGPGIPALGISAEAGALLARGGRVRILLRGEDVAANTPTLVLELPGRGPELVVISAHLDGHPLGESAIDNATGLAAAIALARAIAPEVAALPRGVLLCVFGAEEWALAGSRAWLAGLPPAFRARLVLNLNLDSIAGSPRLTALTSDFPALGGFVQGAAAGIGAALGVHLPLMSNSDHANFAAVGCSGATAPGGLRGAGLRAALPADRRRHALAGAGGGVARRDVDRRRDPVGRVECGPGELLRGRGRDRQRGGVGLDPQAVAAHHRDPPRGGVAGAAVRGAADDVLPCRELAMGHQGAGDPLHVRAGAQRAQLGFGQADGHLVAGTDDLEQLDGRGLRGGGPGDPAGGEGGQGGG